MAEEDRDGFVPAGILSNVVGTGSDKRVTARLTKKFEPKTWKPIYDTMLMQHCLGRSNIFIAKQYGYTPQQVCNILTSKQGVVRKRVIAHNLQEAETTAMSTRLEAVATKFMSRIEAVAEDDELFQKAPFAFVDRGLALIKGLGRLQGGDSKGSGSSTVHNTHNDNRTYNAFSDKALGELRDAINFSRESAAMHELPAENTQPQLQLPAPIVGEIVKQPVSKAS